MNQSSASYLIRDRVAESAAIEVLRAPLENSSLNLAICRQPLPQDVVRFLDLPGWKFRCYEIFKPYLPPHDTDGGFFSKYPPNGYALTSDWAGIQYNRDSCTYIHFSSNAWNGFVSNLGKRRTHPLIQYIDLRRQEIMRCFNASAADIELRFEAPCLYQPIEENFDWHSDGTKTGMRILSVLKGKRTEFIRTPYVRVTAAKLDELSSRKRHSKQRIKRRFRYALGKRFDTTRQLVTRLSKVESLGRGHLANIVGSHEPEKEIALLHRRSGSFRSRIVMLVFPKT